MGESSRLLIFLTTPPELGDVSQDEVLSLEQLRSSFLRANHAGAVGWAQNARQAIFPEEIQPDG